ncbi:hypothetical protein PHYPSEUDO_015192 [Phytophthora pseudosyringae]|uniref:Uncharacterized protein n=1 Tax=Phytophthora pseudosyringae TaxID=221518 RepID=A0A8T1V4E0_9STRA|nr:hypothetical protein PHYPSEUDO_015192 [Phytophthora pseudosyringae]
MAELQAERNNAMGSDDLLVLRCTGTVDTALRQDDLKTKRENGVGEVDIFAPNVNWAVSLVDSNSGLENCAIVDRTCWGDYYGPFAARALVALTGLSLVEKSGRTKGIKTLKSSETSKKRAFRDRDDGQN